MCVEYSKRTQNSRTNPNSETKNRGAGVEHRGVCVCGMFEKNPKLENKPKTRKQKIVRDKINLLLTVGKSKIKKLKVKLLLILIFNLLRRILFNTYFNFQPFRANEISLESSSFIHCEYCIFK